MDEWGKCCQIIMKYGLFMSTIQEEESVISYGNESCENET